METIIVRNIDAAALKKIDSLAKKNGVSRNEFLKRMIESLSVLEEIKMMENRYEDIVNKMGKVIELNSILLEKNNQMLQDLFD